jgi:hypothetical protein
MMIPTGGWPEVETFMIDRVMILALVGMGSLRRFRAGFDRITRDERTLFRRGWVFAGLLCTLALALATAPPDRERLATAIERAGSYLNAAVGPDGQFVYRRWPDGRESKQGERYNVLRHAGTLYVLAIYDRSWRTDPAQRAALRRAGRFLRDCCLAPPPHRLDLLAVWSPPELEGPNKPLQAKLGGAGLGLAALLELEKVEPDFTPLEVYRNRMMVCGRTSKSPSIAAWDSCCAPSFGADRWRVAGRAWRRVGKTRRRAPGTRRCASTTYSTRSAPCCNTARCSRDKAAGPVIEKISMGWE